MDQPMPTDVELGQGLFEGPEGSVVSDEALQPCAERHQELKTGTFFDLESRSSLSSTRLLRASNYTTTSAVTTTTSSTTTNFIYNPPTFLISRSTSAATAMTGAAATIGSTSTGSAQYHNWLQPQARRQRPQLQELDLLEPDNDDDDDCDSDGNSETDDCDEDRSDLQSTLFGEYGYHLSLSSPRPSSSDSNLQLQLQHDGNDSDATPDATQSNIRVASDGSNLPSMSNMTREEFEALPPTIQRKYFSTLERLRFAQHSSFAPCLAAATQQAAEEPLGQPPTKPRRQTSRRQRYKSRFHTDSAAVVKARSKPRIVNASEQRFYTSLPDKIKRRHLSEEEQLVAHQRQQSVMLDAADESLLKLGRRQSQQALAASISSDNTTPSEDYFADMPCADDDQTPRGMEQKTAADSLYDSFRWLEEDDDLDLRLFLDDYHINLREEMPRPSKSRRPSFRRHLSISKLPFGRSSVSFSNTSSRPGTKDTVTSPHSTGPFPTSLPGSPGHSRKKSRALSLISPNKQSLPDASTAFDPSATHYQDPEARAKLRVYLGSPQKFDEAIEFGFPSIDEDGPGPRTLKRAESRQGFLGEWDHELCTFLEDDDRSSILSDDITVTEPDSPKTPELMEKPLPMRPVRLSSEPVISTRGDYAQASATAREMTLRMTLTRPDLRANEDNIYGWQKKTVRKTVMREGAVSPLIFTREISNPKESIERQFAMLDQENVGHDDGVVKRFWNRVRRS